MKKLQPLKALNLLILLMLVFVSVNGQSRSPAVLPVRSLDIPDMHKKYPNGPPDLNKTSFSFDRGIPKTLIKHTMNSANQEIHTGPQSIINLIVFAGAFAILAPVIYVLFFRKKQKGSTAPMDLERHLKIAKLPEQQKTKSAIDEKNQQNKIKKAS